MSSPRSPVSAPTGEVLDALRELLVSELGVDREVARGAPETPLVGRGIGLDSVEVMALAVAIERRFGIRIEDDELRVEAFTDLASIERLVVAKRAGRWRS